MAQNIHLAGGLFRRASENDGHLTELGSTKTISFAAARQAKLLIIKCRTSREANRDRWRCFNAAEDAAKRQLPGLR
jgi:hypothetical protein